ncbi:MAG TPA: hypothetical protein VMR54_14670, partial [Thermoanaerobaculia bacterium]|nr:hypothetical protein [Thermoanaerobaculia bacterium]
MPDATPASIFQQPASAPKPEATVENAETFPGGDRHRKRRIWREIMIKAPIGAILLAAALPFWPALAKASD